MGGPKKGWFITFIVENLIKMHDSGVSLFQEAPISQSSATKKSSTSNLQRRMSKSRVSSPMSATNLKTSASSPQDGHKKKHLAPQKMVMYDLHIFFYRERERDYCYQLLVSV